MLLASALLLMVLLFAARSSVYSIVIFHLMETLQEFRYNSIYELADLIDGSVKDEVCFWNYNEEYFIEICSKFSKDTLLHLYIVITAINFYRRDFRKNPELYEEDDDLEKWYSLFKTYSVEFKKPNFKKDQSPEAWLNSEIQAFYSLFEKMAEEVFYILFANRDFLLKFNSIVATTVKETLFPSHLITRKGTLRRVSIPQWAKKAVYHREKGRCVFCNSDLTGIINVFNTSNYDHIVPLDLFGANDPCNLQLSCEKCNKSKNNKAGATSNFYMPWWTKK